MGGPIDIHRVSGEAKPLQAGQAPQVVTAGGPVLVAGYEVIMVYLTNSDGSTTVTFNIEGSLDGSYWYALRVTPDDGASATPTTVMGSALSLSPGAKHAWVVANKGIQEIRINVTALSAAFSTGALAGTVFCQPL